jgi:hypothetical protein
MQLQVAFLGIDCLRYSELNESEASDELQNFMKEYLIGGYTRRFIFSCYYF